MYKIFVELRKYYTGFRYSFQFEIPVNIKRELVYVYRIYVKLKAVSISDAFSPRNLRTSLRTIFVNEVSHNFPKRLTQV